MRSLTLTEAADFLEAATFDCTRDHGFAIVHTGQDEAGEPFILVNNCHGETVVFQPK